MNHYEGDRTTALIQRHTVSEMVTAYKIAVKEIEDGHAMLARAESRLSNAFGGSSYDFKAYAGRSRYGQEIEAIKRELKKDAWKVIAKRLELRKFMSIADCRKFDDQLEAGTALPEIEEDTIWNFLQDVTSRLSDFKKEACKELFNTLRPWRLTHKTNEKNARFELGEKIILVGWVSRWMGDYYTTNHYRDDHFRQLDNVFRLLDGKGIGQEYHGELATEIVRQTKNTGDYGETEFFRFNCFKNGNLHLTFKRMDLVQKLNEIGGEGLIK